MTPYSLVMLIIAAVGVVIACVIWRRPATPGARRLILAIGAITETALANALLYASTSLPTMILWHQTAYAGYLSLPPLVFLTIMHFTQKNQYITAPAPALLMVIPIITLIVLVTNSWHHLMWSAFSISPETGLLLAAPGPWFLVMICYSYSLIIGGCLVLLRSITRTSSVPKPLLWMLLVAIVVPAICNVVLTNGIHFVPGFNWTTVGEGVGWGLLALGIVKYQILGLAPIARAQVVDSMTDGLLVLDLQDRIVDINPAAQHMLRLNRANLVGKNATDALAHWPTLAHGVECVVEIQSANGASSIDNPDSLCVDVKASPLQDQHQMPIGRLFVWRNITAQLRIEQALSHANAQLQQQLDEITALQNKLRSDAIHDELTGLYNRRCLMEMLPQAFVSGLPLSLVMMDLDHLKKINDTCGHKAGDVTLQQFARLLQRNLPTSEPTCGHADATVYRYGGDEFVALLPHTRISEAATIAQQWCSAAHELIAECADANLQATLSVGIACQVAPNGSPDSLLASADRALYEAKAQGRDRVVMS